MPKTHLTVAFSIPTTSMSRVQDVMGEIKKAIDDHKGNDFLVTIVGPIADNFNEAKTNGTEDKQDGKSEQRSVDGRGERSADDGDSGAGDDGAGSGSTGKRGRGRPRKSDGDTASAGASSRKRDERTEDDGGTEGSERAKSVGTRKGSDEGSEQGEGGRGGSTGSRDDQRGNREAARVTDAADDWDADGDTDGGFDEEDPEEAAAKSSKPWPDDLTPDERDIDKPYITKLLGDHYTASGGKDRTLTFDIMEDATKTRKLAEIDESDYVTLAKALLKDIARYKYGVKKAK